MARKTPNIQKTAFGTYRARYSQNGQRVSKNFTKLKDAQSWLKKVVG